MIDSCFTFDEGFETAIRKMGSENWVIVERYKNKEEMAKGHAKWCEFCKTEPEEIYSVQLCVIEKL